MLTVIVAIENVQYLFTETLDLFTETLDLFAPLGPTWTYWPVLVQRKEE